MCADSAALAPIISLNAAPDRTQARGGSAGRGRAWQPGLGSHTRFPHRGERSCSRSRGTPRGRASGLTLAPNRSPPPGTVPGATAQARRTGTACLSGGGAGGAGYLAADGLHAVQPVQRLLRVAQVLLQLRVQDPHGEGDHGAWEGSGGGGVSLPELPDPASVRRLVRKDDGCLRFLAEVATVPPSMRRVLIFSMKRHARTSESGTEWVSLLCPQLRSRRVETIPK